MYTFSVNVPSLILLTWLASEKPRSDAVIQPECTENSWLRRKDGCVIIQDLIERELSRLDQGHQCSSVFTQLLRHQLARVQEDHVEWALRGKNAVYFQHDTLFNSVLNETRAGFAAQSETQVLCCAIQGNLHLCKLLLTQLQEGGHHRQGNHGKGDKLLCDFFIQSMQTVVPSSPGDFLLTELLRVSLAQIDWEEIVQVVLTSPCSLD